MGKALDLTGRKFGKLLAIKDAGKDKHGKRLWLSLCDCGKNHICVGSSLVSGRTRSCGCIVPAIAKQNAIAGREKIRINKTKHGQSKPGSEFYREYTTWESMRRRCQNPKNKDYHLYGGRGITVCKEWQNFDNFLKDMGRRPKGRYSIDRENNSLGYNPENCRWATDKQQANNRRAKTNNSKEEK